MNQNTSVDNDLQKAIDDITKTTAGDPIFADSVAAPEPTPVETPVAPAPQFATPEPTPMPTPPAHPVDPMVNPVANPNPMPTFTAPAPLPAPTPVPVAVSEAPVPVAEAPAPAPEQIVPAGSNKIEEEIVTVAPFVDDSGELSIKQVKEAALRGLAPILSKMDVPAEHKFDIYKNVIDNYHDSSVLEPAYRAASEIADDKERGEALLYLVDSIDGMNS